MVWPGVHGMVYAMAWRASHGIWYGLVDIAWLMVWPGEVCHGMWTGIVQDLFHDFLNNFEMAIFLLFFHLFIISFLHYVNVIFKKREPLIKWFFAAFVRFKHRYKMSGDIFMCAKKPLKGNHQGICSDSFL